MFVNDDIDLYRETIEGDRYLHNGEWRDLELQRRSLTWPGEIP